MKSEKKTNSHLLQSDFPRRPDGFSGGARANGVRPSDRRGPPTRDAAPRDFDYGPISRAEMHDIVLEMIG
jgi:hypothetical protein